MITENKILEAQNMWAEGLLKIGLTYKNNGDYTKEASNFIDTLYNYKQGNVLFKPTLASQQQFRLDKDAALSYFVGGNPLFKEDKGFALKGWKTVRFENAGIKIEGNIGIAMGNYYFGDDNNNETKVEYSFIYKKIDNNIPSIILHDSHIPYKS
tara:strand:+ start:337 stop:798 length:462 start_codon:yes stop_codon:yes gene_type:complete